LSHELYVVIQIFTSCNMLSHVRERTYSPNIRLSADIDLSTVHLRPYPIRVFQYSRHFSLSSFVKSVMSSSELPPSWSLPAYPHTSPVHFPLVVRLVFRLTSGLMPCFYSPLCSCVICMHHLQEWMRPQSAVRCCCFPFPQAVVHLLSVGSQVYL